MIIYFAFHHNSVADLDTNEEKLNDRLEGTPNLQWGRCEAESVDLARSVLEYVASKRIGCKEADEQGVVIL